MNYITYKKWTMTILSINQADLKESDAKTNIDKYSLTEHICIIKEIL